MTFLSHVSMLPLILNNYLHRYINRKCIFKQVCLILILWNDIINNFFIIIISLRATFLICTVVLQSLFTKQLIKPSNKKTTIRNNSIMKRVIKLNSSPACGPQEIRTWLRSSHTRSIRCNVPEKMINKTYILRSFYPFHGGSHFSVTTRLNNGICSNDLLTFYFPCV